MSCIHRISRLAMIFAIATIPRFTSADDRATTVPTTSPATQPATAPIATGQPVRFTFQYAFDKASHREWVRTDDEIWEERYPDGRVTRYRVVGPSPDAKDPGTIVTRLPDHAMEVYIPNLENADRRLGWRYPDKKDQWFTLGQTEEAE